MGNTDALRLILASHPSMTVHYSKEEKVKAKLEKLSERLIKSANDSSTSTTLVSISSAFGAHDHISGNALSISLAPS